MRTMASALWTFLGDMQLATHHGEPRGFLKVVWYCGMYMQIFQSVSGSPYHHWQLMPVVARSSSARPLLSNLFSCRTYIREWYLRSGKDYIGLRWSTGDRVITLNAHRPSVVARAPEVVSARPLEETCSPCIDLKVLSID